MKSTSSGGTGRALALLLSLSASVAGGAEYTQSFTAANGTSDLGDGSVIKGNVVYTPSVQLNRLVLTTNANNNNSAFHIPALANTSAGWTATFDFTISDNTPDPPAEGFSFSYGNILFGGNSSRPEEGWPGRTNLLSFEVDIAVNGDGEVGPAIGLNRPANIAAVGGSTHSSSLAFTNGDILPDDGTVSGTATVSWIPGLGASFTTTGLATNAGFTFVPTPGFSGEDVHTFALAGRTAGSNAQVTIDNIAISSGTADSDGDGMTDIWELAVGLDPNSATGNNGASGDPDGDGLTNSEEYTRGSSPTSTDTDRDGLGDAVETGTGVWASASNTGTSPNNPDTDGDGLSDGAETNTGVFVDAGNTGTNPHNTNTDGDGLTDLEEVENIARDPNLADDPDPDSVYIQDFDSFTNGATDLGDGTVMMGSAVIVNGALQLTSNTNNLNAAFHIPARTGASTGFTLTFDYTIIESTGNPADGFAFTYGALPFGQLSGQAEEGFPGSIPSLSFEMDTYLNAGEERGPTVGVNRPAAFQGTVANTSGPILNPNTTVTGTFSVTVLHNGVASFTTTGAVTNADFQGIVTGFEMLDTHTFALTARTGGANETVLIDNIELIAGLPDTDGDGMSDAYELGFGLDPTSNAGDDGASGDPDGDGISNIDEHDNGTNPSSNDTDGDGLLDNVEDRGGTYVNASMTGTDPTNPDTDGDGLPDGVEDPNLPFVDANQPGTDPNNPNSDGDSVSDGGEVRLNPINGRDPTVADDPPISNRYQQDFDLYPDDTTELGDNTTMADTDPLRDVASVQNGQLRIMQDGLTSARGSFRIPPLRNSSQGWTASFDFTLADGPGNNNPADGFNFSYGVIPPYDSSAGAASPAGHGAGEEGWLGVDHLSFEVDTWDAASDWGVNIASEIGGVATDHAFTNGAIFNDGTTVNGTATISWNPVDGASFTTTGLLTNADFQNIQIPGFNPTDDYVFAFGTRTGSAHHDVLIDNLVITTGGQPLALDIENAGDDLVLTWESTAGRVYDVVTSATLDVPILSWDILLANLPTTAPENVQTVPRPADPARFYAVIEKEAPAFFEEGFESGQGDWITGVTDAFGNTQWEIGMPTGTFVGPLSGAEGSANCAGTNLAGPGGTGEYGANSDIFLRSPVIDLTAPGIAGATLTMQHFIDTDLSFPPPEPDRGILRVIRASDNAPLGAPIDSDVQGISGDWELYTAPFPPEAVGEMVRLEFQFLSNDNGLEFGGWYIDNVEVKLE